MATYIYSRINYKNEPCHILIDGKMYDCTVWKDFHPGGDEIMMKYHNKDATDIFYAFHGQAGIDKLLKMKSTPLSTPPAKGEQEFREFRQKLIKDGLFQTDYSWYAYKTTETLGIGVLGLILTYYGHWFLGALLLGISYQQQGWLAHDFSHQQCFENRRFNNFMAYFVGSICSGYSVNWWKERHNSHHAITNVLEGDPDVDNLPLFVWAKEDLCRMSTVPFAQKIIPFQHFYFLPFTFWLKIIWKLQSLVFLSGPHNAALNKVAHLEKFTVFLHYLWVSLVMIFLCPSWGAAIAWYMISELVGGACIANIVFMNHYACKQMSWNQGQDATFLELQLLTTRNVAPTPFMNWFAGGLNLQIEHHLFPTMPRHNLLKIRPQVQDFAEKVGMVYLSESFVGCLSEVLGKLKDVADEYVRSSSETHKKGK